MSIDTCVIGRDPLNLKIRSGTSTREKGGTSRDVSRLFTRDSRASLGNASLENLALIKVKQAFDLAGNTTLKIEPHLGLNEFENGYFIQISGWNYDKSRNCDSFLQACYTPFMTHESCQEIFNEIPADRYCTNFTNLHEEDLYEADVGDLVTVDGKLAGFVSDNGACSKTPKPPIFTGVLNFFNSIAKNRDFLNEK